MGNRKSRQTLPVNHGCGSVPSDVSVPHGHDKLAELQVIQLLCNLPKFDREKQDFPSFADDFIASVDRFNARLDVKARKSVFATLFDNGERTVYNSISADLKANEDWDGYVIALTKAFHPFHSTQAAIEDFLLLSQLIEESVISFRGRVEQLGRFAYPLAADAKFRQSEMKFVFIRGLKPLIRMKVREEGPETMEEAFKLARRFEDTERIDANKADEDESVVLQVNALSLNPLVNSSVCYLSKPSTNLKFAEGYVVMCSGQVTKLSEIESDVELFGAENAIDLLIMRGSGKQIDWTKESEKKRIGEMCVCKNHIDELLLKWKSHKCFNRKQRVKNRHICRLPNAVHENDLTNCAKPVAKRRLNKEEAIRLMNGTGVLCHVGAAICNQHFHDIDKNKFHDIKFEEKFYNESMRSSDEGTDYAPSSRESSVASNNCAINIDKSDEIAKQVQNLAHTFGLNRLSSEKNWKNLKPGVQDKKIKSMIRLIDGICKVSAGEDWNEFRTKCVSKIGLVDHDSRVSEIMTTIASALEHCPIRSIIQNTGCTSYDIRQAKISKNGGIDGSKEVFHRIRLDRTILKNFIAFLTLPEVVMCLPSSGKSFQLESGESVDLAKAVRVFSFREIYRMYLRYFEKQALDAGKVTSADITKFVREHCLGFSTAQKLMEILVPLRRKRLQCIDNFQAESIEAFEYLNEYVNELASNGKIDRATRSDLLRRSRVSNEQRVHMEKESNTINHCLRYLLSDPKNKEFASPCDRGTGCHTHDQVCTDCLESIDVFDIFLDILNKAHDDSVANKEPESMRLRRMIEQIQLSKNCVMEYRMHQIRSFASELDRKEILESLQPKEALIVLDFALKIIPTGSVEVQSAWYEKAGISYHMSYCVANLDGSLYHHSFGHTADDLKQDSIAVSAITEHVLRQVKENGVEKVYLRSDNAGCYHNAAYLSTLFQLSKLIGIEILGYLFSEAQSGKGDADREISHSKRKIRDYVDAKGNARNANEIVKALCAPTLLKATSFHEIIVNPISISKSSFPGITSYGSFRFEATGIKARKYDINGDGHFIDEKKMFRNEYSYKFGLQGGIQSKEIGYWKKFEDDDDKEVENTDELGEDPLKLKKEGIFCCSDRLCISVFLTQWKGKTRLQSGAQKEEEFGVND